MKVLFAHPQPFAQFGALAQQMLAEGWDVRFAHRFGPDKDTVDGITMLRFDPGWPIASKTGDYHQPTEYAGVNALGFLRMALAQRDKGYVPDLVIAHCGWGVGLCVKDVWPECRYVAYHEWYYTHDDAPRDAAARRKIGWDSTAALDRIRNMPIIAEFVSADENWCPTQFQASRFPPLLRDQITVLPDGVDDTFFVPDPSARLCITDLDLQHVDHILTYTTRGMEPIRGFPEFMRAVAQLQKLMPMMHTVIAGADRVYYGDQPTDGYSWRARMINDLDLDLSRIHFVGFLDRADYRKLLQASGAHVYFSAPFVTSWSLTEAMMAGCLVIGSDTDPVREFVHHDETGLLVDMADTDEVVETLHWALQAGPEATRLREAARDWMLTTHAASHVLPSKTAHLRRLIGQ